MSAHPREGSKPHGAYALLGVFVLLATGILIAGYSSYRHYEQGFRIEAERQLSAVANLKVGELLQWRRERLADGTAFATNTVFSGLVRQWVQGPNDAAAGAQLRAWLGSIQAAEKYERVILVDERGAHRMSVPETLEPVDPHLLRDIHEVIRSGRVGFLDFHRERPDGPIHLAVLVPILDGLDKRSLGVLVLRIDPERYLYPLLQRWPTASETAETLLVRREGNDVLFLNELRFQKNTALTLRRPLTLTDLPAAKAALGKEGIVEGVDYRGVPVVTALRAVPDSPWSLVAKASTAEAYSPLRQRLWQTIAFLGALLLAAGAGVGFVWRQHELRSALERAEALHESEARLRRFYDSGLLGVIDWNMQGPITGANDKFLDMVGYTREDLEAGRIDWIRMTPAEFRHLDEASVAELRVTGVDTTPFEKEYIRKDGTRLPVLVAHSMLDEDHSNAVAFVLDITERKLAEESLRASEARYRTLVENIPQKIFMKDRNYRFVSINEHFARDLGLRPEEVVGKADADFFPSELAAKYHTDDVRVMETGKTEELEERYLREGRETWVNTIKTPVRDAVSHEIVGLLGVFWDITDRKRADAELHKLNATLKVSEARLIEAQSVAHLGSWEWDAVEDAISGSAEFYRLFGVEPEEIARFSQFIELLHPDDRDRVQQDVADALKQDRPYDTDYRAKLGEGGWRDINARGQVFTGLDGKTVRMVGTCLDITARKRAEQALTDSAARFKEMIESLPQLFWTCTVDGPCDYLSTQWVEYTGIPERDQLGYRWLEQLHPDDRERTVSEWMKIVKEGRRFDLEFRIRRNDGVYQWFTTRAIPMRDAEGTILKWFGSNTDVDEIKKAQGRLRAFSRELEEQVATRTRDLEAANKELEAFSYSVSHDLRAPLRAIDGYGRILMEDYEERLDTEGRRVLGVISSETRRMGQLIDDLLALSRLGRKELECSDFNMTAMAQAVFDEQTAQTPNRVYQLDLKPLLPAHGDRAMIRVVLGNLLSNAIKFTKPRSPAVIEVGSRQEDGQLVYYVKDNGVGFDMTYAHKLFGVFQRLHSAEEFEGTGVGLALVQRVIHRHGGRAWAEAKVNEGATFCFSLPNVKREP